MVTLTRLQHNFNTSLTHDNIDLPTPHPLSLARLTQSSRTNATLWTTVRSSVSTASRGMRTAALSVGATTPVRLDSGTRYLHQPHHHHRSSSITSM